MPIVALDSGDLEARLHAYWHSAPLKVLARRHGLSISTIRNHRAGIGLDLYRRAVGVLRHIQDDRQWRDSGIQEEIHALRHQVDTLTEQFMGGVGDSVGAADEI